MLKRFTTHTFMALAEASLVALLVVGLIAGTAFAGRGGGGKPGAGGSTSLSCAVAPDPVAVGSRYTVTGSGYPTGVQFIVEVTNTQGTMTLFAGADASGNISAGAYAWSAERHSVKVFKNGRRSPSLLANCSFSAY